MRVAVIGCGAIADAFHIPALLGGSMGQVSLVLVDPDVSRAQALAHKHGLADVAAGHREVIGKVDAAIVASPHGTHVPIGLELVAAGIPILVEKPLGTSTEEIVALRDASSRAGVAVAVNHTRRFIPAARRIRQMIQDGSLGEPRRADLAEGDRFAWPAATAAMFGRRSGGRGVLLDVGVHVLDLMTWWFGPELQVDDYRDDALGGSEAAARVDLSSGGLGVSIFLSWLAKQRNRFLIEGTEATVEWGVYDLDAFVVRSRRSGGRSTVQVREGARNPAELATEVQADFARAVAGAGRPQVAPEDCLASMRIIEACYGRRERFDMPWQAPRGSLGHVL